MPLERMALISFLVLVVQGIDLIKIETDIDIFAPNS